MKQAIYKEYADDAYANFREIIKGIKGAKAADELRRLPGLDLLSLDITFTQDGLDKRAIVTFHSDMCCPHGGLSVYILPTIATCQKM